MQKNIKSLHKQPLIRESVQNLIKDYILDNQLRPGDALPSEALLAEQLGAGRNSVREAVRALEALGILEIQRGKGIFVRAFSIDPILDNLSYDFLFDIQELVDIWETRKILELQLIPDAIRLSTDEHIAELQTITLKMKKLAYQGKSFIQEDREYHNCLFQALDNKVLLKLLDIFWLTFHKAGTNSTIVDIEPVETYQDHVAIYDAVANRDVRGAVAALKTHYWGLEERLKRIQEEDDS